MDEYFDEVIDGAFDKLTSNSNEQETSNPVSESDNKESGVTPVETANTKQEEESSESKPEPEKKADSANKIPKDVLSDDTAKRKHAFYREIKKAESKKDKEWGEKMAALQSKLEAANKEKAEASEALKKLQNKVTSQGYQTDRDAHKLNKLLDKQEELEEKESTIRKELENIPTEYNKQAMDSLASEVFKDRPDFMDGYNKSVKPNIESYNKILADYDDLAKFLNKPKGKVYLPLLYTWMSSNPEGLEDALDDWDEDYTEMKDFMSDFQEKLFGYNSNPTKEPQDKPKQEFRAKVTTKSANQPTKQEREWSKDSVIALWED